MTAVPRPADEPQSPKVGSTAVFLTILAGLGWVGPFSIDAMFPAFTQLGAEWGASEFALQQIISVYMLAFAAMSLFHGPLSDALGRRPVIIVGVGLYVLASIGSALAPNLGVLLVFRAVQGLSAGAGQIISRAMVRDVYSDAQAQRTMSQIAMIFAIAPALAPMVGGWLLGVGNWRTIFWFLAAFGVLLLAAVLLALPETHPADQRSPFSARGLSAGLLQVWRSRDARRLAFAGLFNFAGQFLYISAAQLFVVKMLGLGDQDFWVLFVPLISGMVIGSWLSGRLAGRLNGRRLANLGYAVTFGAAVVNVVLCLIPATQTLPWVIVPLPFYSFGVALAFPIITLAMLDLFPQSRGAASSVQSFVALLGNAAIAGLLAPALGTSLWSLALGALVLTSIGWALWRRHVAKTTIEPRGSSDAPAFEPID
jgi:MFS transporter, DHA1 family, multidrug resistance protein